MTLLKKIKSIVSWKIFKLLILNYRIKVSITKKNIKIALKELFKGEKIDALWIPNDNVLLEKDIIEDIWIPLLDKYKVPVAVGLEIFVRPELNFGTFAVLPDHFSLGNQVADMIFELKSNSWVFGEKNIEPPISVHKIINYSQAKERFGINDQSLENIDIILK